MKVPLLAGWNSAEVSLSGAYAGLRAAPTVESYEAAVRKIYGDKADEVLPLYKASYYGGGQSRRRRTW
jgi:para-nitrobenzyl esterase